MISKYKIETSANVHTAKQYTEKVQAHMDVKHLGCGSVEPNGTSGFVISFGKRGYLVRAIKRTNGHTIQ